MMRDMETVYVECACNSDEHTLRYMFSVHEWDGTPAKEPEIYTSVFLNDWEPWYKRLWKATKYVFGYKCKYGHWDCTLMKPMDAMKLRKLLEEFAVFIAKNPDCAFSSSAEDRKLLQDDGLEILNRK